MSPKDLQSLFDWLSTAELVDKPVNKYSKTEIVRLVEFIQVHFCERQEPCAILVDHADRLIVPANAPVGQMHAAIQWIQKMVELNAPGEGIEEVII